MMEPSATARRLLRSVDSGILSTLSVELEGYPFGSVTPYVLTHEGQIVVYVSSIAQHTVNMLRDPRVCLTVMARGEGNQQALGRATAVGDATVVDPESQAAAAQRYFSLFPEAASYAQTHEFLFFGILPKRVRYIGGFGQICWIEADDWAVPAAKWVEEESRIVEHMNDDHSEALINIVRHSCAHTADKVQMLGLDPEGFHVRADSVIHYLPFEAPCLTSEAVHTAMVKLARDSAPS